MQHTELQPKPAMISSPASRQKRSFFDVFEYGAQTRVAFVNGELPHFADDPACREELLRIIRQSGCRRIVFHLERLRAVNSSLVALLLLPVRNGVEVHVEHPPRHLREVLHVTQVDRLIHVERGGQPRSNAPREAVTGQPAAVR